jgi:cell division protein FtsQ
MRLKKKIRKIFHIALWALLFTGAWILVGFADSEQNGMVCRQLLIRVDYGRSEVLVTEDEIGALIEAAAGRITGRSLRTINTSRIEQAVGQQPYVAGVEVYETFHGEVVVAVTQRQPLLRVISPSHDVFLGNEGVMFPVNPVHPVRVPVATGCIPDSAFQYRLFSSRKNRIDSINRSPILEDLLHIARRINRDPFFRAQAEQIFVTPQGEYELIPKVGNQVVLLGNADDLEDKFRRLFIFYRKGLNQIGWNKYNYINLKYKNQVVCSNI